MIAEKTAIAGIGWTAFSKDSGRRVIDLAAEASLNAAADAGLDPYEIDGLVTSYWAPGASTRSTRARSPLPLPFKDCRYRLIGAGRGVRCARWSEQQQWQSTPGSTSTCSSIARRTLEASVIRHAEPILGSFFTAR
jgi:hypothetical protein